MKKIIMGRKYDTNTARSVGYDEYGQPGNFHHWEEELFQKKNGEFFLYGNGGPRSKYCIQTDINSWSGGEKIIPMTEEEAKDWAEVHLSGEKYEEIFGAVDE